MDPTEVDEIINKAKEQSSDEDQLLPDPNEDLEDETPAPEPAPKKLKSA